MFIKLNLLFLINFIFACISQASTLKTENLSDGSQIAFYKIDDTPASQKQLQKIEDDINSYIKKLFKLFEHQSPKKNLSDLYGFKKHLDNIFKKNNTKYKITNTPLSSRILLLSYFLESLPNLKSFHPKNCQEYIHRLTVTAHVSLKKSEPTNWLNQMLELTQKLCQKNTLLKVKNKTSIKYEI